MKRTLGLVASLIIGVGLGACGGGSTSGPDAPGTGVDAAVDAGPPDATPVVTADDICGQTGLLEEMVAKILQCNPGFDLLQTQGQATPSKISEFCNAVSGPYLADHTEELMTYAELQACLAYISGTSCNDLNFDATACDFLHGKVANAAMCEQDQQCADASYCNRPNPQTCGTCTAKLVDGMTCTRDEQCSNGKCVGTQCGHPGGDGDACAGGANSDDCLGQRQCNPQTNKCETKTWQLNDVCPDFGACGILNTDLWCKPSNGTSGAGQCAYYLAIGDTCNPQNPGAGLCDLRSYNWCNMAAAGGPKCAAPNVVQEGQPCSMFGGNQCANGLVCSNPLGQNGRCYTPGAKDDQCGLQGDPPCGLFLGCLANQCEYVDYSGNCPPP